MLQNPLIHSSIEEINLNLPGEESIEAVIARHKNDAAFVSIDSACLQDLPFSCIQICNERYYIGVIKYPRDHSFKFQTPPGQLLRRASAWIYYHDIISLLVQDCSQRDKFLRFFCR